MIAVLEYVFVRYALGPEGLVIRRGLLFRSVRHVPYGRIQNIDLRENPLHRLLRVAEVQVQTASGEETEARIRELRGVVTAELEKARAAGQIGSSLQAAPTLFAPGADQALLTPDEWAEVCIVSGFSLDKTGAEGEADGPRAAFHPAPGAKCDRCWRVLPEVGRSATHPTLCLRCEDAVESLAARTAA